MVEEDNMSYHTLTQEGIVVNRIRYTLDMSKKADKVVIDSKIADKKRLAKCLIWRICPKCGGTIDPSHMEDGLRSTCRECGYWLSNLKEQDYIDKYNKTK